MGIWLAVNEPRNYEFICNETGDELPEMRAHWERLEFLLDMKIKRVTHTVDLIALCEQMEMLPNFRQRWCTRILKIEPTIDYMESLPPGSILYVGLRADEEMRTGIFGEDMQIRFPLRELGWGLSDVIGYLARMGIKIPDRTDCALCPYQKLNEWHTLWQRYPERFQAGVELERLTGHTFRSEGRDTWPAKLEDLAKEFASGRKIRPYVRKQTCRVCSL